MKKHFDLFLLSFLIMLLSCSRDNSIEIDENIQDAPLDNQQVISIPDLNTLGVLQHKLEAFEGYTLFTIYKDTYLIDLCGRVVNHWTSSYERGGAFELLADGSLLRAGKLENPDIPYGGLGGVIEKFDWQGNLTWHYVYSSSQFSQHHGLKSLPNGNIIFIAVHRKTYEEAVQAGRDPEKLLEGELYDEQIIEIRPMGSNGAEIVWQWNAWDHLVQEFDDTKDNFGPVSKLHNRIDINFLGTSNGGKDWLHFNSLEYNENLDQIIISSQKLSELYIIDHSTSTQEADGNSVNLNEKEEGLLYRWGNPLAYKNESAGGRQLYGQHNPHWIPDQYPDGGKILIFNNGLGRTTKYSSVDIIDPEVDIDGNYVYSLLNGFGPEMAEWSYTNNENPTMFYSRIVSSAQRLPNGNTLVCEGTKGRFFELNDKNDIIWEYINPETSNGTILKQGDNPESNVFKAVRYGRNYIGFLDKNLTPGNPIELDFNIGNCQ